MTKRIVYDKIVIENDYQYQLKNKGDEFILKRYLFIAVFTILALLVACTSNAELGKEKEEDTAKHVDADDAGTDTYSLENDGVDEKAFAGDLGNFPSDVPERVITTSVPITEMLYLLGVTPVGVPTSTNPIPADFETIDKIGSPMQPDLEILTNLKPDLIIGAKSLESSLEKNLEGIDLETAYLETDSFDDLKLSFKVLGMYFNKTEEMNKVMSSILEKENELMMRAEGKELPSVMLMIGTADSFMVMNEKSYLGSLIQRLGAENIATTKLQAKETYSPINMEDVVVADPDIIFVLASGDHGASENMFNEEVKKNDIWTNLSAYKNNQIHILDYDVFGVTSILHVEEAMTNIADYIYQ